jgi:cytochrome d ubiquinol oxidase subunit II
METFWFALIAFMLTAWVVLDGFDFGAGIVHLLVARDDEERRAVLGAIGPLWDGNEVWLIAAGGVLFFAFPRAYAAAFSGFYLPFVIALWLLVARGVSIEFRSLEPGPLWRSFWDAAFALCSASIALVLGVALGNVVRGVPLEADGFFSAPLFTDFRPSGSRPGALDVYTLLVGAFALVALAVHGALFLHLRTSGALAARCRRLALRLWGVEVALAALTTAATALVQPALYARLVSRPWAWLFGLLALGGAAAVPLALRRGRERAAFLGQASLLVGLLAATAAGLHPLLLRSSLDPAWSLEVYGAAASRASLRAGLLWWLPAIAIAVGYFVYLFRSFAGKVVPGTRGYG